MSEPTPLHSFRNLFDRLRKLWPAAEGKAVQFTAPSTPLEPYQAMEPVLIAMALEPREGEFEEADLPLFLVRFPDGYEHFARADLISTSDPAVEAVIAAASSVFEAAGRMGYDGPADLEARGTDAEKSRYLAQFRQFIRSRKPPTQAANDDSHEGPAP